MPVLDVIILSFVAGLAVVAFVAPLIALGWFVAWMVDRKE